MSPDEQIQEDNWVVLSATDGKKVLGHVSRNSSARIGKRKRKIGALLGARWGDLFAVRSGDRLEPVEEEQSFNVTAETEMGTERNNQYLEDTNENQKLEQSTILAMKEQGIEGEQLVRTVVENSLTFRGKTAFSQEKYIKRKRAKFDLKVRVLRPTALTLCETYFERSPEKTMHLRPDGLAILLGYAGVRSGCRALVYENCTGLVTAAVAERIDGVGKVINIFSGTTPPGTEVIRMLNLDSLHTKAIVHTPIELLGMVDVSQSEDNDPLRYVTVEDAITEKTGTKHVPSARRAEAIAMRAKRGDVKSWIRDGCDCLIVATRFDVVQVFDVLLKHLAPSGCFAAYCMHLQDAADLQYALQLSKMAMRVELLEVSLVNHQVLPGRSHPAMTDSATGGYIVSGVRIAMPSAMASSDNGEKSN
ncbi:unnamed protein product [Chondrus crispus]|uniref:tRNA (adenine(58)-N(1))-methyltransferase non-catalytic subunit TRM6 n=1 Tax=Chondrus crispus TaxID=2769 RepID=R7QJI5_CHOCR|nr:unnamed protein product [Chondrus crispus]CDF37908.1 unnamed protein product [Chondrus crispus]|eukprot:XP_005717779.1 unnamed protein product [Chondrus crispus]